MDENTDTVWDKTCLDDVKSLSLPGTYHEKITSLGTALKSFTRLKNLDLSRNAIQSLQGVESLQLLETLNLYYNNISYLQDLSALKYLTNLKELDLRLNPVTKNEPDYRLYIVHLLPSLKRLDDRSVRDSERRAAIMHFTSEQASEFTESPSIQLTDHERPSVPRADLVRTLGPKSALAEDDVAVLDLITRTGGDLSKPHAITGSSTRAPETQDFTREELRNMPSSYTTPPKHKRDTSPQEHRSPPRQKDRIYVQFADEVKDNTHLKYTDDSSAYTSYSTRGHFTPNPQVIGTAMSMDIPSPRTHTQALPPKDTQTMPPRNQQVMSPRLSSREQPRAEDRPYNVSSPERTRGSQEEPGYGRSMDSGRLSEPLPDRTLDNSQSDMMLDKVLDLVDRYWNGSKSLHHNTKFKNLATKLLSSLQTQPTHHPSPGATGQLRVELSERTAELSRLREQMSEQQRELERVRNKLKGQEMLQGSLDITAQELTAVKARLQDTQEENSVLRTKVKTLESRQMNAGEQERQLGELLRKNNELEEKVKSFSQQVTQQNCNLEQLQELTCMLQESHKSLVATNDHLLRELDEVRQRHNQEVHQLHWSYDKLKNTMDWLPNASK
ncbi:centrosomal protein of 72 kDa isoform X2 [Nematostella vectensis]|uniref:centrosomal protein of 72 kDa isoform X2 n=1 Tax=Nematostella vectensis TaxID=45351 RepID=UPI002076D591|nr:centrosomal protein of 72 kDa isoform X2 [Nematostella vectensis]